MTPSTAITERSIDLPATAAAAGIARRELTATPGIAGELGYKALLLASELIGACLQEMEPADAAIGLTIRVDELRVRIEVTGRPSAVPLDESLNSTAPPSLGGYGLRIVDRMADSWGTQGPDGATVWFELLRG